MKISELSRESKIYGCLSIIAVASLFMKWVDYGFASRNGIHQQGWIVLIPLLYITITNIMGKYYKRMINLIISILSAISVIFFMFDKIVIIEGKTVNFASTGLYLMILVSLGFVIVSSIEIRRNFKGNKSNSWRCSFGMYNKWYLWKESL